MTEEAPVTDVDALVELADEVQEMVADRWEEVPCVAFLFLTSDGHLELRSPLPLDELQTTLELLGIEIRKITEEGLSTIADAGLAGVAES